jgi:hypothetical protein
MSDATRREFQRADSNETRGCIAAVSNFEQTRPLEFLTLAVIVNRALFVRSQSQ